MKKKISILLALVVCFVMVFCFVGCSLFGGKNDGSKKGGDKLEGVSSEKISEMDGYIDEYLDALLLSYAQEEGNVTNQSKLLQSALKANTEFNFLTDKRKTIKPSINVKFDEATSDYTVTYVWNKTLTKTYTKGAKTVHYNGWAGKYSHTSDYEVYENEGDVAAVLDTIANALCVAVNNTYGGAKTKAFSANAQIGIDVMGFTGSILVKGNVDLDNADNTEIAIELLNGSENAVAGLYYEGATNRADAKLIVAFKKDGAMKYYYINYFALNQWLQSVFTSDAWAMPEDEGLAGLLGAFSEDAAGFAGTIASVVDMIADGYYFENADGSTVYVIDLNLGNVIKQLSDLLGDLLSTDDGDEGGNIFEGIPVLGDIPELAELDLATMHGLLGHLTISTVVADDVATDFEIALNVPECTFYFNEDEEEGFHFDVPAINFALFVKDYQFTTEDTIEDVIPDAASDAQYFSPTNIKASGDIDITYIDEGVTKLDSTFTYNVVTNINPLNFNDATLSVVIDQKQAGSGNESNFLTVIVKNGINKIWLGGSAITDKLSLESGAILKIVCTEGLKGVLGFDETDKTFDGVIGFDAKGNAVIDAATITDTMQTILDSKLGEYIIGYYYEQLGIEEVSNAEGGFDMSALEDIAGEIKDFYDSINGNSLKIDLDAESFSLDLTEANIADLSDIVADIAGMFGKSYTLKSHLTVAKLFANCEGYESKLVANVVYDGNVVDFTCDWSEENKVAITFNMVLASGRTYSAVFTVNTNVVTTSATKWTADFEYSITSAGGTKGDVLSLTVGLSDFHFTWGKDTTNDVAPVPTEKVTDASETVIGTLITKVLSYIGEEDAKLYDKVPVINYTMVKSLARFITRQVA